MQTKISNTLKLLVALIIFFAMSHSVGTAQSKVGTTTAQFLGIAVGPRAIAMGGAYVASSEDGARFAQPKYS